MPSSGREQSRVQRPESPPAMRPLLPQKQLRLPQSTLVLDWAASELVKGLLTRLSLVCSGPFKLWGDERRGSQGDWNGGPRGGGQAPPEIKGPGRNRGSGAALSPMAAIHSSGCSTESGPATTSSGPSGEGRPASGSVPLAQWDSRGLCQRLLRENSRAGPSREEAASHVWAA